MAHKYDLYSDCPSLKQYGKHQCKKGVCRHCGFKQDKKTYLTFLGAAQEMILRIPERSFDPRDAPSEISEVYETSRYDELSGQRFRVAPPTAPFRDAFSRSRRQFDRIRDAIGIQERIKRTIDPQFAELAKRLSGLDSESDAEWARRFAERFVTDVARYERKEPTRDQLEHVYAASLYCLSDNITEEEVCERFAVSKSTLQTWTDLLRRYDKMTHASSRFCELARMALDKLNQSTLR